MHATVLELEEYVSGRLDAWRSHELDVHCEGCDDCAAAVAREARLEVSVRAVGAELRCGARADVVELALSVEPAAPVGFVARVANAPRRGSFFALAAAAAIGLAFVAAHLPAMRRGDSQPGVLLSDAGDLAAARGATLPAFDDVSGGTP